MTFLRLSMFSRQSGARSPKATLRSAYFVAFSSRALRVDSPNVLNVTDRDLLAGSRPVRKRIIGPDYLLDDRHLRDPARAVLTLEHATSNPYSVSAGWLGFHLLLLTGLR